MSLKFELSAIIVITAGINYSDINNTSRSGSQQVLEQLNLQVILIDLLSLVIIFYELDMTSYNRISGLKLSLQCHFILKGRQVLYNFL